MPPWPRSQTRFATEGGGWCCPSAVSRSPGTAGTIAVGDRLRVAAGVERSNRTDPLGGEPATVLRRPRVVSRSPSRSWLLRVSEAVRAAARQRALDSLPPERAGLLVGIALGDTVALRASRPLLAGLGIVLIVLFALLTRWEPSVLRASAMAVLALLGVATGRRAGCRTWSAPPSASAWERRRAPHPCWRWRSARSRWPAWPPTWWRSRSPPRRCCSASSPLPLRCSDRWPPSPPSPAASPILSSPPLSPSPSTPAPSPPPPCPCPARPGWFPPPP